MAFWSLTRAVARHWPWWAFFASALMLAIAHAFETFAHLAPCTLCLKQREVYWAAMGIAAAGIVAWRTPWRGKLERIVCAALALAFLVGMGIAVWHAGAEWKWWPGPATCASGGGTFTADGLSDFLDGAKQARPACDEALWSFLGLSMAGWNVLISAKLAILSGLAAFGWGAKP